MRQLNLIHLFDFYLAAAFLISTSLRFHQYQTVLGVVRSVPGRWPRLFDLVRSHGRIFVTWSTIWPALLALLLFLLHSMACRLVWPKAHLTLADVLDHWLALPFVAGSCLAMVSVDVYGCLTVSSLDRTMLDRYFDQAEFWLKSWTAPVVRVFTLGYVDPRRMVHEEVRKALIAASQLINDSLWWTNLQVGLRVLFGACLWSSYALIAS